MAWKHGLLPPTKNMAQKQNPTADTSGSSVPPEPIPENTGSDDSADFEVMAWDNPSMSTNGWLVSADELLLPDALNNYRKPVAAIHCIPARRDTSLKLSARKLMEAMPLAVQLDLRSRSKEDAQELVRKIREERATPLFEIRTKELVRLAGLSVSNMERIHDTLAELLGFPFSWNVLGEAGDVDYEAVAPFLIRRDKGVGRKAGYTRFAFEPEILLWFLEPKMWANLSWAVMSGIGRSNGPGQEAAFGLYQNIWRYIGTAAKVTPLMDVATWIDLTIGPSRFVKVDAHGVKQVVDYKDFKRRYLLPGLAILNAHKALNHTVVLQEDRSGRKIVRLRFKFNEKLQGAFDFPLGWPAETCSTLQSFGFTEKEISNLSQLYPFEQVAEALKRMPAAENRVREKGATVYSRKAFFGGILGNVAKGETQTAEEEAKVLKDAAQQKQKEDEAKRMQVLQTKFATHQRGLLVEAMKSMPEEDKDALFQEHCTAEPGARTLLKGGEPGPVYLMLFCKWLAKAHPDLYEAWLPELKDQNLQSWLAWQLTSAQGL